MFEDVAGELPARPWRLVKLIVLLPSAYSNDGFPYRQSGCAFQARGFRSFRVAHAARRIRLDAHKFGN